MSFGISDRAESGQLRKLFRRLTRFGVAIPVGKRQEQLPERGHCGMELTTSRLRQFRIFNVPVPCCPRLLPPTSEDHTAFGISEIVLLVEAARNRHFLEKPPTRD